MSEPSVLLRICSDRDRSGVFGQCPINATDDRVSEQRSERYRREILRITRCAWSIARGEAA